MDIIKNIKNAVIISIQSTSLDPTDGAGFKEAYMKSAIQGGAKAFRLAGTEDVKLAKKLFPDIPVIGITKPHKIPENYKELVYITPTVEDVKSLIEAGADIIAFDGTKRHDFSSLIKAVEEGRKLAMADISTFEEAFVAQNLGVDIVSTTLSGYTMYSKPSDEPDFELLEKCVQELKIPVIMEGKLWEKAQVKRAFALGAHAVVIGSAVTRPWLIVERFVKNG